MPPDLDPTSKVCTSCQQNQLRPSFIDEESDKKSMFKVRLEIRTDTGNQCLFSFIGYATSKKAAKKEAAIRALQDSRFRDRVNPDHIRPGYRKDQKAKTPASSSAPKRGKHTNRTYYGSADENVVSGNPYPTVFQPTPADRPKADERASSNPAPSTFSNDPRSAIPNRNPAPSAFSSDSSSAIPNQNPAGRHNIMSLYYKSKKLKLRPEIKFVCLLKDGKPVVKITVGSESKAAQGANDLEAIEKASAQFDLNSYNCKPGNPNFENDGIAYYNILNQLHLKTLKEFNSSCLLSVEENDRSLFLWKCQLGEFVSYGLDESIGLSQNAAAHEILIKLRCCLNDEVDELSRELDEIETKRQKKQELIEMIDSEMGQPRLASREEYEEEYDEYERQFDEEHETKMFHDL